jgi:3-hydroxyacyl-[acyl-carrier-protein] dehydratase
MTLVGTFRVEASHPSLPGHFPGRPVVPGVVLLDEAMAHATPPGATLAGFDAVKFTRPVLPGEAVEVLAGPAAGDRMPFACRVGNEAAVRGTALLTPAPTAEP